VADDRPATVTGEGAGRIRDGGDEGVDGEEDDEGADGDVRLAVPADR
jgi:hypothetical protein